MDKALHENIRYSQETWAKHTWFQTAFLYTEKIHYHYFYCFLRDHLKDRLRQGVKLLLVDIGFGSGYPIARIAEKYPIRTIGLDMIPETVDQYNRKKIKNSNAIKIDPVKMKLPFKENQVDFVICSHLLEHVADDIAMLSEIRRVLKKDGLCYFNIPINEERYKVPNHLRKYSPAQFDRILKKNGFRSIRSFESDNFTLWVTSLGLRKSPAARLIKKALILFLSLVPVAWLERLPLKKSQYICFAEKLP